MESIHKDGIREYCHHSTDFTLLVFVVVISQPVLMNLEIIHLEFILHLVEMISLMVAKEFCPITVIYFTCKTRTENLNTNSSMG